MQRKIGRNSDEKLKKIDVNFQADAIGINSDWMADLIGWCSAAQDGDPSGSSSSSLKIIIETMYKVYVIIVYLNVGDFYLSGTLIDWLVIYQWKFLELPSQYSHFLVCTSDIRLFIIEWNCFPILFTFFKYESSIREEKWRLGNF